MAPMHFPWVSLDGHFDVFSIHVYVQGILKKEIGDASFDGVFDSQDLIAFAV